MRCTEKQTFNDLICVLTITVMLILTPVDARAYIGPGVGLGAIGLTLGFLGSVILAFFAILYYPVKRFMRNWGRGKASSHEPKL